MGTFTNGLTPARANASVWARGTFIKEYATRELRPVEVMFMAEHRDALQGRVLELGCGAGRVTGYLIDLAEEVHGIDLSPAMIAHCRRTYPGGIFHEGDFTDLSQFEDSSFGAVLAPCNVLDVLDDGERRAMLEEIGRVLEDGGLLFMSSHNRGFVPKLPKPTHVRTRDPLRLVYDAARVPRRVRNHKRLVALEQEHGDYRIINDSAHEFSLLHYYISRDAQERQFSDHGFELVDCLDLDGHAVPAGGAAPDFVELHYVARSGG